MVRFDGVRDPELPSKECYGVGQSEIYDPDRHWHANLPVGPAQDGTKPNMDIVTIDEYTGGLIVYD